MCNNKDIDTLDHLNTVTSLNRIQTSVLNLLRYLIEKKPEQLEDEAIRYVSLLCSKDEKELNQVDQADLYVSYKNLSVIAYPATATGIAIAREVDVDKYDKSTPELPNITTVRKRIRAQIILLWTITIVYILLQGYVTLQTDLLQQAEQQNQKYSELIKKKIEKEGNKDQNPDLKAIENGEEQQLIAVITATYNALYQLSRPWRPIYFGDINVSSAEHTQEENITIEFGTKSMVKWMNYYIIPPLLGLLGSVAFIVRRGLTCLMQHNYDYGTSRPYPIRIALGTLLGVVSGIFFNPGVESKIGIDLPLVTAAFLMGYSVEFAFTLFDMVIEKGRNIISPPK